MNTINSSQILQNLDAMKKAAGGMSLQSQHNQNTGDFSTLMKSAIDTVNQSSQTASKMAAAVEAGDSSVSIVDTMIAMQKARIQSQALMQVRNKVLTAYKDIMNMPV